MTLAMVGRGDVVGTLRRADGSPLEDPTVIARSITNPSEGAQAVPDESGRFRLEDLPVGPIQVVAVDGEAYTSATAQITAPGAEASVELILQVFNHGITAAALFGFVALIERRSGGLRGLEDFGGLRRVAPVFAGLR